MLAAGFHDDPAWRHLLPDPATRARRLRRFFEVEIGHLPAGNQVWLALGEGRGERVAGAAAWAEPGHWRSPVLRTIRYAPAMAAVFGRRIAVAARSLARAEHLHARSERERGREAGHWYLHYLCVEPASQGRGIGSMLLRPLLERCDGDRLDAFLESSTERSAALYERHGFERSGHFRMPARGPLQRQMWRAPAAAPG